MQHLQNQCTDFWKQNIELPSRNMEFAQNVLAYVFLVADNLVVRVGSTGGNNMWNGPSCQTEGESCDKDDDVCVVLATIKATNGGCVGDHISTFLSIKYIINVIYTKPTVSSPLIAQGEGRNCVPAALSFL